MIDIKNKRECCGCTACEQICPVSCIKMVRDQEGFLYPLADSEKCIQCGACNRTCPIQNSIKEEPKKQMAYLAQNKNERIRKESTSGGVFSALAEYIIDQGGVVYGAAYDQDFQVIHTQVEDKKDLSMFRNSKYVQSNLGGVLRRVRKQLESGRRVLFTGTPCQIEGLKAYLKKDYQNLLTMDFVCHAVPSPLIWSKYLELQKQSYGDAIGNILFREKHYGYQYSTMTVRNKAGKDVYSNGVDTDPMLRAFFSDICDRPSCYDCRFKKRYRVSDLTVWDCYPVYKFARDMDDNKGTSRVLIQSEKGREAFNAIIPLMRCHEISPDMLTQDVKEMFQSVSENSYREMFFHDANLLDGKRLFQKYFPETIKTRTDKAVRIFCCKTGIYASVKRAVKMITGRE